MSRVCDPAFFVPEILGQATFRFGPRAFCFWLETRSFQCSLGHNSFRFYNKSANGSGSSLRRIRCCAKNGTVVRRYRR